MAKLRITWKRSTIGRPPQQERVIKALGFHRLGETVVREDIPTIRGMVNKISHRLEWENVD